MRRMMIVAIAAALSTGAMAGCDNPVVDEVGLPNMGGVENAARAFGNAASADVRVRVFNGLHGSPNLDALKDSFVAFCADWHNSSGGLRSSMIMLFYAPGQKPDIGFYYGVSSQPKLSGKWQDIIRDKFVPAVTAHKAGESNRIGPALIATLGDMSTLFLQRPTGTTIINQAADHSGLWKWLMWLTIGGALAGSVFGLLAVTSRMREDRRNTRSAQADARRVRSEVVSGLLEISDETLGPVLQAKVNNADPERRQDANRKLADFHRHANAAMSTFMGFDHISGPDPNADGLSVGSYQRNEQRYSSILIRYITPARRLAAEINAGKFLEDKEPEQTKPSHREERKTHHRNHVHVAQSRARSQHSDYQRAAETPAASPSVVFVETPVIVERESRSWRDDDRSNSYRAPPREERESSRPSRSNDDDGGSFSSSSSSDDSGGSFSSSSSSDSGGSYDSGSSSSDSGGSSSSSD